jgi:hypothetical protein
VTGKATTVQLTTHDTFSSLVSGTVYTVSYQAKRTTTFAALRLSVDGTLVQAVERGADADWVVRSFTFTAGGSTALFTFEALVFAADLSGNLNLVISQIYLDDFHISTPGCNTGT